jgi:hypothetical protein
MAIICKAPNGMLLRFQNVLHAYLHTGIRIQRKTNMSHEQLSLHAEVDCGPSHRKSNNDNYASIKKTYRTKKF